MIIISEFLYCFCLFFFLHIYIDILGIDQSDRMVLFVFVLFIVACLSVFALSVCLRFSCCSVALLSVFVLSVFIDFLVAVWCDFLYPYHLSVFVFLVLWRCCLSLYSLSSSIFLLLYGVIFCIRTICLDLFSCSVA